MAGSRRSAKYESSKSTGSRRKPTTSTVTGTNKSNTDFQSVKKSGSFKKPTVTTVKTEPSKPIKGESKNTAKAEDRQIRKRLKEGYDVTVPSVHKSQEDKTSAFERLDAAEREKVYFNTFNVNTPYYEGVFERVTKAMNEYIYSADPEQMSQDMMNWYKENYIEEVVLDKSTGEEYTYGYLKATAPPPPLGKNAKGETIDLTADWKAFVMYQQVNADTEIGAIKKNNDVWRYAAGVSDKTPDSLLDVIRDTASGRADAAEGFGNYVRDYVWNPLKQGDFGTLGMNVLVNLGETMDVFSGGARAALATQPYIYGGSRIFEGQEHFIYSGGEELQLQLLELGAEDLLKLEQLGTEQIGRTGSTKTQLIKRIKDAGLYDEYLKLKEEWSNFEGSATAIENIKAFYTEYDKNFYADTGSKYGNFVVEVLTDPTLLLGTTSKLVKKAGLELATNPALLRAAAEAGIELEDTLFKKLAKTLGNDIFSMSKKTLDKNIDEIVKLVPGLTDPGQIVKFKNVLKYDMYKYMDSATYNVVKGVYKIDRATEAVDSALLKASLLGAPTAVKKGYGFVKNMLPGPVNHEAIQSAARAFDDMKRSDGGYNPAYLHTLAEVQNYSSDKSFRQNIQSLIRHTKADMEDLKNTLIKSKDITAAEARSNVDAFIQRITDNNVTTLSAYKDYLNNTLAKNFEVFKGELQSVLEVYYKELDAVDSFLKDFEQRDSAASLKEIKKFAKDSDTAKMNYTEYSHKNRNPFAQSIHSADIKTPYNENDILVKFDITPEIKKSFDALISFNKNSEVSDDVWLNDLVATLDNGKYSIPELIEKVDNTLRSYHFKEAMNDGVLKTDADWDVEKELVKLHNLLSERTQLVLSNDAQIIKIHRDKADVLEQFISNEEIANAVTELNSLLVDVAEDSILAESKFSEVARTISSLRIQILKQQEYNFFKASIADKVSREQYLATLQALSGISFGNPRSYVLRSSRTIDEWLYRIETTLASQYSSERLSLDGFRTQAKDFSSEFYQRFKEEIQLPEIQERIKNICTSGHLDPADDVRVQMLQMIMKSEDAVTLYNKKSEIQDVFFLDIETTGLNKEACQISSIATKKWVPITDDMTLAQILDIIEDVSTVKTYQVYRSQAELAEEVTDDLLDSLYRHNSKVGVGERRLDYYKRYSSEANGGKVYTEKEMLHEFMHDMDTSWGTHKHQLPYTVVHNNNGFDTSFITTRANVQGEYFNGYKDLSEFAKYSLNSLTHLKEFTQNGTVFTYDQKQALKEAISKYANTMANYGHDFTVFSPKSFYNDLVKLRDELATLNDSGELDLLRQSFTGLEDQVPRQMQSCSKQLFALYDSGKLDELIANTKEVSRRVGEECRYFDNHIIYNPFLRNSDSEVIDNFLKKIMELNGEMEFSALGYDIIADENHIAKYFDGHVGKHLSYKCSNLMQKFAEDIASSMLYKVRSNHLVAEYVTEYNELIQKVQKFAREYLEDYDTYGYYTYLKTPSTPMESFLMVHKMWNDVLKYGYNMDAENLAESRTLTKDIKEAIIYQGRSDAFAEMVSSLSNEAIVLLSNPVKYGIFKGGVDDYYPAKFENDILLKSLEISSHRERNRYVKQSMANLSLQHDLKGPANAKEYRIQSVQEMFDKVYKGVQKVFADKRAFSKLETYMSKASDIRRTIATEQIIGSFLDADDFGKQIKSHLLFNNHIFILPLTNESYIDLFVKKITSTEIANVGYQMEDGHIFVYLKNDSKLKILNDASGSTDEMTMMLGGDNTVYTAPKYHRVAYPLANKIINFKGLEMSSKDELQKLLDNIQVIDEKIDELTQGVSAGSTGEVYTYTMHKRLLESLPLSVKKDMLHADTTCDARLWHQASYNRVILGSNSNHWRISNWEEPDLLLNLQNTLYQVAGQHSATMGYLDTFFGKNSNAKMMYMFHNFSEEEVLDVIRRNTDHVVVYCKEGNTDSGFEVFQLELSSVDDVKKAMWEGAVYVPYEVYTDMVKVFNESTISNSFLKAWAKGMAIMKVGQLFKPATAARNLLDGFIKAVGDTGSVSQTFDSFVRAAHLLNDYDKVAKQIAANNRLGYYSENYIKTLFERGVLGTTIMDYDTYSFLSGLLKEGPMGGMSHQLMDIVEAANKNKVVNLGLKPGNTQTMAGRRAVKEAYDLIGDTVTRFKDLGEVEIQRLVDANSKLFKGKAVTPEMFMMYIREELVLEGQAYLDSSDIISDLITYRAKEAQGPLSRMNSAIDGALSNSLSLMSKAEGIIRLGEYIALENQGYTKNDIFRKIAASQFDYDVKSSRTKMIELLIPYYTFEVNNLAYWVRQLDDNPMLLHYLETIWGELSFDAAFENYGEDDPTNNMSLEYMAHTGGVPIGTSGLYMKVNPSFYSAMDGVFGGPSALLDKLAPPIQYLARYSLDAIGADYWNLMNEVDFDFSNEPLSEQLIRSTPMVSSLYSMWKDSYAKQKYKQIQGNMTAQALVAIDPFMFGAITRYHSDENEIIAEILAPYIADCSLTEDELRKVSWESFLVDLEKQGKWYDKNWGKVVPLSQKNADGLNGDFDFKNDPGAWDRYCHYQKLYKGKFWDYNQRRFVTMAEYIPGMLNRKFDFENDKNAWEEFCYYNEELFGTKWDNNQGAFVTSENYIEGGLNADDLTFAQLCILKYAIHGETWNQETKKFEQTHTPLVSFDMVENDEADMSLITIRQEDEDVVQKLFTTLMPGSAAYGSTLNQLASVSPLLKQGQFIFNNDPANNVSVIQAILNTVKVPGMDFSREYKSGTAGGYNYVARPFVKDPNYKHRAAYIAKYGGGFYRYSTPYTGGQDMTGIKMVTSGNLDYDSYYSQNYNFNYRYKNPVVGVADYPQSKLGIQRYMRMRTDSLQRRFRSRVPANARRVTMDRKITVKNNLNRIKLGWWNR